MIPPLARLGFVLCVAFSFSGCKTAAGLFYEPKPTDRLDGYDGSLAQAGINTEMDWGPKQNLLLSEFKTLREEQTRLERRLEQVLAENQNLKTQVNNEASLAQREKTLRVQLEAQGEQRQQKLREQEATILSLRIEKAKLEQANLVAKIETLRLSMEQLSPNPVEASATPPGRR